MTTDKSLSYQTASALADQLRKRQISSVELLEHTIQRIESLDAQINAVVVRDFGKARAAAIEADKALSRGDEGLLLGLPMTIKESYAVAGLPATWGVPGAQKRVANDDAVIVKRLKHAGAIIIGKTNVPLMLGDWQTYNDIYGTTNNPWNLEHSPGGSSGGSAAALAAGYVSLELGSDLNGSLRVPAHCCGVFAHKPSFGIVPQRGHAPPGAPVLSVNTDMEFAVCGPLARSATDLALSLKVIAGPDSNRQTAYRLSLPEARHKKLKDFRVLVLDQHPLVPTSSDVKQAIDNCFQYLISQKCFISRSCSELPNLTITAQTFAEMMMALLYADMPTDAFKRAQAEAAMLRPDDLSPLASVLRGRVLTHRDWVNLDRVRTQLSHQWRQVFRSFDVVICPVMPIAAYKHDHGEMDARTLKIDDKIINYGEVGPWSSLASFTGLPATVVPIGKSSEGLPIGMQIIGPYLEDLTTIGFAECLEREFCGFQAPPMNFKG